MKKILCAGSLLALACPLMAGVFLNEIYLNPPGSFDDSREFIELMGTPGKKLDGYAVAVVNGTQQRFYPLGSLPPRPAAQEIDEFFSLDGLSLGPNGILVIALGTRTAYPTMLDDTNFQRWNTIWNGLLDTPGKLENDGSNTVMLIRNRPGATQATHPTQPVVDLRWGKDIRHDDEVVTPVVDPQDGLPYDQYGANGIDRGGDNGTGGTTLDLRGASTPAVTDDLEVVDEISYEHDRGWEYDTDDRHVDLGSTHLGLPPRRVHALDDSQGLNPDALSRVDSRKTGPGWAAAGGGIGELINGNNWQDTATDQWVRGEGLVGTGGQGGAPQFFYDNNPNTNPDAIQPFMTQVPRWLNDGTGAEYNYATLNTYQIMAGRVNPFANPYVPGDADRDGDADSADIALIASVFGDGNWIFSNSFAEAPESNDGDPADQTRPWDVDQTGDNGIESSDLQWALNFQGDATGRVVGRRYDSTTPSASGVQLNPAAPVSAEVTATADANLMNLGVGQNVTITVSGRIATGANQTPGQQNGVMQFANDLAISAGGLLRVTSVQPAAPFATTRAGIQLNQGVNGDLGVRTVNGHTTSFTQGLTGAVPMYRVTLQAIGTGTGTLSISPAQLPRFAASTPRGLKVGHTDTNGNPASTTYPTALSFSISGGGLLGDMNCDGTLSVGDIAGFVLALTNPAGYAAQFPTCNINNADMNQNGAVTVADIGLFVGALTGA